MVSLEPRRTALVAVDLMDRIVALPLGPRPGSVVAERSLALAAAFRETGATVVAVRVERPNVAEQPPGSDLVADLVRPGDLVVVKRSIGAFHATGLDELLRERGVDTIVLTGIATNMGVESTARVAADLDYELFFVEDAMTALSAEEHEASVRLDLPRFGTVCLSDDVLGALRS
ncbi:MAG: isochorismatase family protein [Actinomycetota bacterium]|nr:isochorismatase family protein [Actinomycetota bacterium]